MAVFIPVVFVYDPKAVDIAVFIVFVYDPKAVDIAVFIPVVFVYCVKLLFKTLEDTYIDANAIMAVCLSAILS